jgi:hypothetical protein
MSSFDPIDPTSLRNHADDERVERIWSRIAADLPTASELSAVDAPDVVGASLLQRRSGVGSRAGLRPAMAWGAAAAIALGLFGSGVLAGRSSVGGAGDRSAAARPMDATPLHDVFAAGSSARSFALPGGGRLALEPGSMVEVVQVDESAVTLRLVSGRASVDAAEASVAVLAGDARISAPAGSSMSMQRHEREVEVEVALGDVEVDGPTGRQRIGRGDRAARIPTHAVLARRDDAPEPMSPVPSASAVARLEQRTGTLPLEVVRAVVAEPSGVAVAPWMSRYQTDQIDEAFRLLEQQGGLETAIGSAQGAKELMALSDIAFAQGRGALATRALRRVADEFAGNPLAYAAAMSLARVYADSGNRELAARYRDMAKQASAFGVDVACGELRDLQAEAQQGDAPVRVRARAKAVEVLARFPQAFCAEDARDVIEAYGDAKSPEPAPTPAPATSGSASVEPDPAAPAPSAALPAEISAPSSPAKP